MRVDIDMDISISISILSIGIGIDIDIDKAFFKGKHLLLDSPGPFNIDFHVIILFSLIYE